MKRLLYITVFSQEIYQYLAALLLLSVKNQTRLDQLDILIYCDPRFAGFFEDLSAKSGIPITVLSSESSEADVVWACWRRYDIFEIFDISGYSSVLYLDTDILVDGDLAEILRAAETKGVTPLAAIAENPLPIGAHPNAEWWGYDLFVDAGEQARLKDRQGFSSGVLWFRPVPEIRTMFQDMFRTYEAFRDAGKIAGSFYHTDQPYTNFLAISRDLADTAALRGLAKNNPLPSASNPPLLCHFSGGMGNSNKLAKMVAFILASDSMGPEIRGYAMALDQLRKDPQDKPASRDHIFHSNIEIARRDIDKHLYGIVTQNAGFAVRYGPFGEAGVVYRTERNSWASDRVMKVLGLHESSLHPTFRSMAQRRRGTAVIDLASGDGYFAAGLGRLLAAPRIVAVERNTRLHAICAELVAANCPAAMLTQLERIDAAGLEALLQDGPAILLLRADGQEDLPLQPDRIPHLHRAEILIECHEFVPKLRNVIPDISERLADTHAATIVEERDIVPSDVPELRQMRGIQRGLIACSARPAPVRWLHLVPRAG